MTEVSFLEFLVIAYSFLAFILFVLIASPWGNRNDKKQNLIDKIKDSIGQPAFEELQLSFYDRFIAKGIKAGDIIKNLAPICGGKGGGKPDSAMGGGKDLLKLDDALALVDDFVASKLN